MFKVFVPLILFSVTCFANEELKLNSYTPACKVATLQALGWQIQDDSQNQITTNDGFKSCWADKNLPVRKPILQSSDTLDQSLTGSITQCLFQRRFNRAARISMAKLDSNHLYGFKNIFGRFIGNGDARLEKLHFWEKQPCKTASGNGPSNDCFLPAASHIHEALQEPATGLLQAECTNGKLLMEYMALDQLFGAQKIDKYFTPDDLYVGTDVRFSQSVINGSKLPDKRDRDPYGPKRARLGPAALIGAPGFIGNTYGLSYLDDIDNEGENFVISNISQQATNELIRVGFAGFDKVLTDIWKLATQLSTLDLLGLQTRAEDGKILSDVSFPANLAYSELVRALNNPLLRETQVYVHPMGVRSFAWHLIRLARLNPRTPYNIRLDPDTIHGEVFNRWLQMQLDSCGTQGT